MNEEKIASENNNFQAAQLKLKKENLGYKLNPNSVLKSNLQTFLAVLSTWFPIKRTFQVLVVLLVITIFVSVGYLVVLNLAAFQYTPENVVKKFTALIENPTSTVTDEEKKVLGDITQAGFLSSWGNENNIKTLRVFANSKPIEVGSVEYTGANKNYAVVTLKFQNEFKNPNSKQAKIYLEKYASNNFFGIVNTAYRWRIYQLDMPRNDNILDNFNQAVSDTSKNIDEGSKNIIDSIKGIFK
jgi:hypothetical protein